jgi:hypothetical protein
VEARIDEKMSAKPSIARPQTPEEGERTRAHTLERIESFNFFFLIKEDL